MIRPPEFDPFRERYAALPLEGLTITAVLSAGSAILQYNPLYLDGLLGAAVVRLATAAAWPMARAWNSQAVTAGMGTRRSMSRPIDVTRRRGRGLPPGARLQRPEGARLWR